MWVFLVFLVISTKGCTFTFTRHLCPLSIEGSLTYHTSYDMGHPFIFERSSLMNSITLWNLYHDNTLKVKKTIYRAKCELSKQNAAFSISVLNNSEFWLLPSSPGSKCTVYVMIITCRWLYLFIPLSESLKLNSPWGTK